MIARLFTIFALLGLAAAGLYAWGYAEFTRPGPLAVARAVVVPAGARLEDIADVLQREAVIATPIVFIAGVQLTGHGRKLKAGEFEFAARISPRAVMHVLARGQTVVRRFTVAEGLTVAQVLARLRLAEGLTGEVEPQPEEGSLLPETYHFSYGDTRAGLVKRMQAAMRKTTAALWAQRQAGLPIADLPAAVTLASIVERETALPAERPLVASVFVNRLRRRMRLQSDPTVAYVLSKAGLERPLRKQDLALDDPYNTYKFRGLPPGPIANPGRAAIEAVLHPARSDYLYFVADGSGGHAFARTLAEHNRNVARWRRTRNKP